MNIKKIIVILLMVILSFSAYLSVFKIESASGYVLVLDEYAYTNITEFGFSMYTTHPSQLSTTSANSQGFQPQYTGYVKYITVKLYSTGAPSGWLGMKLTTASGQYILPTTTVLEVSSSVFNISQIGNGGGLYSFTFNGSTLIENDEIYAFYVYLINGTYNVSNTIEIGIDGSGTDPFGNSGEFNSNGWYNTELGSVHDVCYVILGDTDIAPTPAPTATPTATPTPTPVPVPFGQVRVNYFVNPSILYGNFTVAIPPTTNYVEIDNTISWNYYDGTTLLFLPKLASGWYFRNYTLITNTGYNLTYSINSWVVVLDTDLGVIWNFTLGIAQTANTIDLKLIDVANGAIYFQNYVNSVPIGTRYGAGTYNISYGTVLYISTTPNYGYVTDYFTIVSNGLTSQVFGTYLTFIASSNTTITPHYNVFSSTGVTGGVGSIFTFLNSFTWQNIAVLIIYAVTCGLLTYAFAFTGLIAGLDIATIICFIMGLLGSLMYPVLGLVIIANIALIITGSGLLNRKRNGTDA